MSVNDNMNGNGQQDSLEEDRDQDRDRGGNKKEKDYGVFWDSLEARIGLTVPQDLRPILNQLGCANELALRTLTGQHVDMLEQFARKHLARKVKDRDQLESVFGIFADDPEAFEFVPGHRMLLEAIGAKMKEAPVEAPKKRPSDTNKDAAKKQRKKLTDTDNSEETKDADAEEKARLKKEEQSLKSILVLGLQNECHIKADPDKAPLFTVVLDSLKEGKILCHINVCKASLKVSRTNARSWGNQNFYRHVRNLHSTENVLTRQPSLTSFGITSKQNQGGGSEGGSENHEEEENRVDNENLDQNNNGSRWKLARYSRSARAQRQLQIAALDCHRLEEYWPLITNMESVIRENENLNRTVRILVQRITEFDVSNLISQIPGISPFLQALIRSALKNLERKTGGERYERELLLIAAHFFMVAGRKAYTDLHLNLKKIIPSTSSVVRTIAHSKFVPQPGEFCFARLSEFMDARKLPRVVNVSFDGTRLEAKVQYDPNTNQLVGFVPKLVDGVPIVAPFPATSEQIIRKHFDTEKLGSIMMCIMVRPLVRGAPSFCLCAYPTDNKFTATDVSKLLIYIENGAAKFGIRVATFGSDGDTRCLSAMQSRMFPPCDNTLAWRLWFRSSLAIQVPCVQDPTHIGTKLRNLLLRDNVMSMGNFFVSITQVRFLIVDVSKDQHELTLGDIDPKDRMNYRSMEKLCSKKVVELLRQRVPDSEGTCMFLELARDVIDAYVDPSLFPAERLFKIWRAVFFYRGWRQWVKEHPTHKLKTSFLTSNTYTCVEINAHALVILLRSHRDKSGSENLGEFLPWVLGSQDCEEEFGLLRSMTSTFSTVINFSPLEFLHRISRAGLEQDIRQELGPKYKFSESRRAAQNKSSEIIVPGPESLPTDQEIFQIIDHAKQDAKFNLTELGMSGEVPDVFSSFAEVELDSEDENDISADEMSVPGSTSLEVLEETPDEEELDCTEDVAMSSLFAGEVGLRTFDSVEVTPDSPFVKVTDFYGRRSIVKKSSLVWMLGSREKVSNDRGLRYQEPSEAMSTRQAASAQASSWRPPTQEEYVMLGDWCAFRTSEGPGGAMMAGRVLGFKYLSGKNRKYTLRSAPTSPPPGVKPRGVGVIAQWYTVNSFGEMDRVTAHSCLSMESYKVTISRPLVLEQELTLDLRTVRLLKDIL